MKAEQLFVRDHTVLLDGAMGTMLQERGLETGHYPEVLSITQAAAITEIHRAYVAAGCEVLYANTFGASRHKLAGSGYSVQEVIAASLACARAAAGDKALVALDVGPLGELLEPNGSLRFEEAYALFSEVMEAGRAADLIVLETFTDLYELRAALLAAKEHASLPVLCSMSFEQNGRTFTGCTVESFAATAVGLGADAVGINCSLGPVEIQPIARRLCQATPEDFPVFVKPNAGLPNEEGKYDITPELFALEMKAYRSLGLFAVGGCCGTSPAYLRALAGQYAGAAPVHKPSSGARYICSPTQAVAVEGITVVGERINPTGKKRFQQALREEDMDYIVAQAVAQADAGAELLDINVGLPGIDEPAMMEKVVKAVQSVVDLPLQLDSSDPEALERGLRVYNGRPLVNSVNGKQEVLEAILPLCQRYGAAVVGLTLDETGIPPTAAERFAIAQRIVAKAQQYGIDKKDIYIDCLTLTVSAQQENVMDTLAALSRVKRELGVRTILGVSNISFGLPCRGFLNTTFLTMAMQAGLDLAIMNPNTVEMMAAVDAYRVLTDQDHQSRRYVEKYASFKPATGLVSASAGAAAAQTAGGAADALTDAVLKGLRKEAASAVEALLQQLPPMDIIEKKLIPALDLVGVNYETGKCYLPQLLQSAAAAQSAFEVIKRAIAENGAAPLSQDIIVLATVQGDIHDIGKNIVKVILENYGFRVIDLGRDVPPETVVEATRKYNAPLVGLSALMTTTVPSMQKTIEALHAAGLPCKVMVGGAVLTPEYAEKIGADFYAKDAKMSADIAKKLFGRE